ncbi:MAG: HlyD family secretion protein [Cyclobacteriaceae bacterium]|nr:HlyD family secretion protein [Cyclobacteriaceae bacterium]
MNGIVASNEGRPSLPQEEHSYFLGKRSEIATEIISQRPELIVRLGSLILFIVLFVCAITCWYVKYPMILETTAKLTSINAPKPVISLVAGKLVKLGVDENQKVHKDEILGYIESIADHEAVLLLSDNLDVIQNLIINQQTNQIEKYFSNPSVSLGELQSAYQVFSTSFISFDNYLANGFYLKKRAILLKDKANLIKLYNNLQLQQELQEQDLELAQRTFNVNESLKLDKVISDFDFRIEQSKLLNKKLTVPQIKSALIVNESLQAEKEKEMIELENTISQQKLIFQQALNSFKSQVDNWKKKYILTAPIDGKIAFASFMQENQQIHANQTICYINPENSQYFAEVVIPQSNFGKVAVGQQVLLKFQSYPYQEYGSVKGRIEFISHIPGDNGYLAKVNLINGLVTTYGRDVQYRDGLTATAEIITQDMRLLERFYYSIVKQIRR